MWKYKNVDDLQLSFTKTCDFHMISINCKMMSVRIFWWPVCRSWRGTGTNAWQSCKWNNKVYINKIKRNLEEWNVNAHCIIMDKNQQSSHHVTQCLTSYDEFFKILITQLKIFNSLYCYPFKRAAAALLEYGSLLTI